MQINIHKKKITAHKIIQKCKSREEKTDSKIE
jgi:hypothetical protein